MVMVNVYWYNKSIGIISLFQLKGNANFTTNTDIMATE